MITMRNSLRTITLLTVTASLCSGHVGERVVPIFEIPDELLSEIDIHDGDIDDWHTVIGEPTLTGLDLTPDYVAGSGEEYDPSNLDFRIWVAWHRDLNRIYVVAQGSDDVLVDPSADPDGEVGPIGEEGLLGMEIDGDHSGGIYLVPEEEDEGSKSLWQGVQLFSGGPFSYLRKPAVNMLSTVPPEECCWFSEPPYADVGGATYGENPTVWVTEMYVTPFDRLVPESRDETVISKLGSDGIIGLRVTVFDDDDPQIPGHEAVFSFPPVDWNLPQGPDKFADGLLVPVGGSAGSAVESVSWGRIKASLEP